MGEYNLALGNEGGPVPLTVAGESYPLAYLDTAAMGRYETWMEEKAYAAARRAKGRLDAEDYAFLLKDTRDEIRAGAYAWGGAEWQRTIRTGAGLTRLLHEALLPHRPATTLAEAEAIQEKALEEDPGAEKCPACGHWNKGSGYERPCEKCGQVIRPADVLERVNPYLVCTLIDLASSGKTKPPREMKRTAPAGA